MEKKVSKRNLTARIKKKWEKVSFPFSYFLRQKQLIF